MINAEEQAICKRRGHKFKGWGVSQKWKQCDYCGTWARELYILEERADEPPEADLDPLFKMQRSEGAA